MKKLFAIVLALSLTLGCVSALADTLTWWDHFANLEAVHQKLFDELEAETGTHVEYQNFDAASIKDALVSAFGSDQEPDIFPQMFGSNAEISKYNEGYFSPMTVSLEDLPEFVQSSILEGYTMFDGEVYSFPTMALNHRCLLWYNKELVSEVPDTMAEMRELFKSLTDAENNRYAIALPLTDTNRMADIFRDICAISGGNRGFDYATGQYDYTSDTMKQVFRWFVDLWEDGSVHPASTTLKTRTVRERWVNDEVVFALDGTWYPGSVRGAFGEEALSKLAVHKTPVLDQAVSDERGMVGNAPVSGAYYISRSCKNTEAATQLLLKLLSDEYAVNLANAMDQPPLKTAAIAQADVIPAYVDACNIMTKEMGYYPEPMLRNQAVGEVYSEMMDVTPHIGDIYVGYITGAITDWEAALEEYNNAMNAELDRAIEVCQAMGVEVSREDWIFPNYVPGESYSSEKYAELK